MHLDIVMHIVIVIVNSLYKSCTSYMTNKSAMTSNYVNKTYIYLFMLNYVHVCI